MVGHGKDTVKSTWEMGIGAAQVVPSQLVAGSASRPPAPQVRICLPNLKSL